MPVQERDYLKSEPEAKASGPAWLAKLNEIGERHATAIIAASTALIILTVLLFAKGAYDRAQVERAEQELGKANSAEALEALKGKYGDTPVAPRISYKLANKLAEEGKLDAALAQYKDFLNRWPLDPFKPQVDAAMIAVERNRAFNDERKPLRVKEQVLQSHPRQFPALKDPRRAFGPERAPNPVLELAVPAGSVKIELFRYEAPEAVAALLKLVEAKHFDGLKWEAEGDARLRTSKKPDAPETKVAVAEDPNAPLAEQGSVVLARKDGALLADRLEIMTRFQPGLKDVAVVGVVKEGLNRLKKDEAISTAKVAETK